MTFKPDTNFDKQTQNGEFDTRKIDDAESVSEIT